MMTGTKIAMLAAAASSFSAVALALNICSVHRAAIDKFFGKDAASAADAISKLGPKERIDFIEADSANKSIESLSGFALADEKGFEIAIVSRGGTSAKTLSDVGGSITFQLRRGMKNDSADKQPVFFRYMCGPQAKPPPIEYGAFYGATDAMIARNPRTRFTMLAPAYNSKETPRATPSVTFKPIEGGWCLLFYFDWVKFFDCLPYNYGERPISWRLVIERERDDGSVANWGTLADPVSLSWPQGGDKLAGDIRNQLIYSQCLGPDYRKLQNAQDFRWRSYLTERYICFFDPGVETFEPKNSKSDEVYYTQCLKPFLKYNATLGDALFFDPRNGPAQPTAASMVKATFDELFSQLHRIRYAEEDFETLRRDYLLARFTDGPLPSAVPPETKKKAAPAKKKPQSSVPTLDEEEEAGGNPLIDLDDISF